MRDEGAATSRGLGAFRRRGTAVRQPRSWRVTIGALVRWARGFTEELGHVGKEPPRLGERAPRFAHLGWPITDFRHVADR